MVTHLTEDTFDELVVNANTPVVVDFYADWCGPCKMFAPVLEKVASDTSDVKFYKVDVDDQPSLAGKFSVRSIPTIIGFKGGKPAETTHGFLPEPVFREFVAKIQ